MVYTLSDLKKVNGHLLTKDNKYIVAKYDDSYAYWYKIKKITNNIVKTDYLMGCVSYDYIFYNGKMPIDECDSILKILNNVIKSNN